MAYTSNQDFAVAPEVAPAVRGDDQVRVLLGATRLVLNAQEAEALGLQLLQRAKVARGANPAIQHGNTDIHDPAALEAGAVAA